MTGLDIDGSQEIIKGTPHSIKSQILRGSIYFVEPKKMMRRVMEDNKAYAARIRKVHETCNDHDDVATASILEVFIDETERRTWFLFEVCAD